MTLKRGNLKPGDCVSMDQYTTRTLGRLTNKPGRGSSHHKYIGGTLFVDHATGHIFVYHQVSTRVGNTLMGKHAYEQYAKENGIKLKSFHADNWPFTAEEFVRDCELQDQTITHSGVGAHHQNGVSERAIQTVVSWALSMLLHQTLHWPGQFDESHWPFALDHAVYLWNNLPKSSTGPSPNELFTGCVSPNRIELL